MNPTFCLHSFTSTSPVVGFILAENAGLGETISMREVLEYFLRDSQGKGAREGGGYPLSSFGRTLMCQISPQTGSFCETSSRVYKILED